MRSRGYQKRIYFIFSIWFGQPNEDNLRSIFNEFRRLQRDHLRLQDAYNELRENIQLQKQVCQIFERVSIFERQLHFPVKRQYATESAKSDMYKVAKNLLTILPSATYHENIPFLQIYE